ncbi:UNVERIFIED_CONTAM: hypothetical protein HDU68_004752, partial [Siphonaria sp. JEL0065]
QHESKADAESESLLKLKRKRSPSPVFANTNVSNQSQSPLAKERKQADADSAPSRPPPCMLPTFSTFSALSTLSSLSSLEEREGVMFVALTEQLETHPSNPVTLTSLDSDPASDSNLIAHAAESLAVDEKLGDNANVFDLDSSKYVDIDGNAKAAIATALEESSNVVATDAYGITGMDVDRNEDVGFSDHQLAIPNINVDQLVVPTTESSIAAIVHNDEFNTELEILQQPASYDVDDTEWYYSEVEVIETVEIEEVVSEKVLDEDSLEKALDEAIEPMTSLTLFTTENVSNVSKSSVTTADEIRMAIEMAEGKGSEDAIPIDVDSFILNLDSIAPTPLSPTEESSKDIEMEERRYTADVIPIDMNSATSPFDTVATTTLSSPPLQQQHEVVGIQTETQELVTPTVGFLDRTPHQPQPQCDSNNLNESKQPKKLNTNDEMDISLSEIDEPVDTQALPEPTASVASISPPSCTLQEPILEKGASIVGNGTLLLETEEGFEDDGMDDCKEGEHVRSGVEAAIGEVDAGGGVSGILVDGDVEVVQCAQTVDVAAFDVTATTAQSEEPILVDQMDVQTDMIDTAIDTIDAAMDVHIDLEVVEESEEVTSDAVESLLALSHEPNITNRTDISKESDQIETRGKLAEAFTTKSEETITKQQQSPKSVPLRSLEDTIDGDKEPETTDVPKKNMTPIVINNDPIVIDDDDEADIVIELSKRPSKQPTTITTTTATRRQSISYPEYDVGQYCCKKILGGHFVFCAGCSEWLHMACVGDQYDDNSEEDFFCQTCVSGNQVNRVKEEGVKKDAKESLVKKREIEVIVLDSDDDDWEPTQSDIGQSGKDVVIVLDDDDDETEIVVEKVSSVALSPATTTSIPSHESSVVHQPNSTMLKDDDDSIRMVLDDSIIEVIDTNKTTYGASPTLAPAPETIAPTNDENSYLPTDLSNIYTPYTEIIERIMPSYTFLVPEAKAAIEEGVRAFLVEVMNDSFPNCLSPPLSLPSLGIDNDLVEPFSMWVYDQLLENFSDVELIRPE